MGEVKTLYDEDFVAWSREQANALRSAARGGSNQKLDWENLAEEIESLGLSERRELGSQIRRIIEHLLKLEFSEAIDPRRGWIGSIDDARTEIEVLLETSPSLRHELSGIVASETRRALRKVMRELQSYGELSPATAARVQTRTYNPEQIVGDWFPPEPDRGE